MDEVIDKIYIISCLIFIGCYIFSLVYYPKKDRENYEKIKKENPKMRQKFRIYDSRAEKYFKKDTKKNVLLLINVLIGCFVIPIILLPLLFLIPDQNLLIKILLMIAGALVIYVIYIKLASRSKIKNLFEKNLFEKCGEFTIEPIPNDKIISGKWYAIGNIKKDYIYSYKILKYNCLLTNYYKKVLVNEGESLIGSYQKMGNFVEYAYDLKKIVIEDISKVDLEKEEIKEIIEKLSIEKIIDVYLNQNFLVVEKEIVLHGYNSKDVAIEIEDIDKFYNGLVLPIIKITNQDK